MDASGPLKVSFARDLYEREPWHCVFAREESSQQVRLGLSSPATLDHYCEQWVVIQDQRLVQYDTCQVYLYMQYATEKSKQVVNK